MDREAVEDLVHASLGRHLRITCVLGLLLLAVGFILGHFVAAQHTRQMSERWAARAEQLTQQVSKVEQNMKSELAKVRELAQSQPSSPQTGSPAATAVSPVSQTTSYDEVKHKDARPLTCETEVERRLLVARCIEETEREKARILSELQPYLDRKMTIEATVVSKVVHRLVDSQVAQLKTLAPVENHAAPAGDVSYFGPMDISPVSAESTPPRRSAPSLAPLMPIPAEKGLGTDDEGVVLMPLPSSTVSRVPVPAEPSHTGETELGHPPQFFAAPRRKSRVFITSRKPREVTTAASPVVK